MEQSFWIQNLLSFNLLSTVNRRCGLNKKIKSANGNEVFFETRGNWHPQQCCESEMIFLIQIGSCFGSCIDAANSPL
jgi:hypothetical protein